MPIAVNAVSARRVDHVQGDRHARQARREVAGAEVPLLDLVQIALGPRGDDEMVRAGLVLAGEDQDHAADQCAGLGVVRRPARRRVDIDGRSRRAGGRSAPGGRPHGETPVAARGEREVVADRGCAEEAPGRSARRGRQRERVAARRGSAPRRGEDVDASADRGVGERARHARRRRRCRRARCPSSAGFR